MRHDGKPRRVRKLDSIYSEQGGVAKFVHSELTRGERVADVVKTLNTALGETISERTFYIWLNKWRTDEGNGRVVAEGLPVGAGVECQ